MVNFLKNKKEMKKTLLLGLIATALGFSACSTEDEIINEGQTLKKGMVLNATVAQPTESRATIDDAADSWKFAFSANDVVKVTNTTHTGYYAFTNNGTNFICEDAEPTTEATAWYAYFPTTSVSLANQEGSLASVANKFALAGATDPATTGAEGLNITMEAKVAILKINNQKGSLNIQVKTSATDYVVGLKAKNGEAGFDVVTSTTPTSVFATTNLGTYYVAVPAGVQIAVKNGVAPVKSTGVNGLTAGKYYELTFEGSGSMTGTAKATINGVEVDVPWVQLWAGGPKFATYNVGVTDANPRSYGGYYTWGGSIDMDDKYYNNGTATLTGDNDTATKLWGKNWRMPNLSEIQGLIANCNKDIDFSSDTRLFNGVTFSGRDDYSGNSIFLPAGGNCDYCTPEHQGVFGAYWSASPINGNDDELKAYYLCLETYPGCTVENSARLHGHLVRAVLVEDGDDAPDVVPNLLPGKFTVGEGKQVQFTNGNLYWNGSEFKFEDEQIYYPIEWDPNHVGHFFWTKTQAASYAQTYNDGTNTKNDVNFFAESNGGLIVEGTAELYALSQAEWKYLFEERPNAANLVKPSVAVAGGTTCLVIAPDNFSGTLKDSYSLDEANELGLVCLPNAGLRIDHASNNKFGDKIEDTTARGGYWTSTPYISAVNAYWLTFTKEGDINYCEGSMPRNYAMALRLVCPVK